MEVRLMSSRHELPSIAKLASKFGIAPLKKFGQNFIFDETLCDKIVRASRLESDDYALEIGPGPAGLTRSILKANPANLTVIETDSRCLSLLAEIQKIYPNLIIQHGDALKYRVKDFYVDRKLVIIANLPYNIGTALVLQWLSELEYIKSMTVMLQKEVVERITSAVGGKAYGRLSVICQLCCKVENVFDVGPKAFYPEPKVWSSIIRFTPLDNRPDAKTINSLERVTNLAFAGRRKMVKSSLKALFPDISSVLHQLGIDDKLRAENLSPEQYLQLARIALT